LTLPKLPPSLWAWALVACSAPRLPSPSADTRAWSGGGPTLSYPAGWRAEWDADEAALRLTTGPVDDGVVVQVLPAGAVDPQGLGERYAEQLQGQLTRVTDGLVWAGGVEVRRAQRDLGGRVADGWEVDLSARLLGTLDVSERGLALLGQGRDAQLLLTCKSRRVDWPIMDGACRQVAASIVWDGWSGSPEAPAGG
jgi:hypothetical protein